MLLLYMCHVICLALVQCPHFGSIQKHCHDDSIANLNLGFSFDVVGGPKSSPEGC